MQLEVPPEEAILFSTAQDITPAQLCSIITANKVYSN